MTPSPANNYNAPFNLNGGADWMKKGKECPWKTMAAGKSVATVMNYYLNATLASKKRVLDGVVELEKRIIQEKV